MGMPSFDVPVMVSISRRKISHLPVGLVSAYGLAGWDVNVILSCRGLSLWLIHGLWRSGPCPCLVMFERCESRAVSLYVGIQLAWVLFQFVIMSCRSGSVKMEGNTNPSTDFLVQLSFSERFSFFGDTNII